MAEGAGGGGVGSGPAGAASEMAELRAEIERLRARLTETEGRVGEVVARLAHELRTPLGAMLMWAHVLGQGREEDRVAAVAAIEASARAQSQLVGRLLDLTRGLAGRLPLVLGPVDLRVPAREGLDAHRVDAAGGGVALEASVGEAEVGVVGDADRLRDVTSILVSNGIKFTPPGGLVRLSLVRDGSVARLDVSDSGQGIAAADIPEMFVPFRASGERLARDRPGLGVGLALAHQLVRLHGGTMRCASGGRGQGSQFTIELPLAAP